MTKTEKILYDSIEWIFYDGPYGFTHPPKTDMMSEEKLWDKIREVIWNDRYVHHITSFVDTQIDFKEEPVISPSIYGNYTNKETKFRRDGYVIVYYQEGK